MPNLYPLCYHEVSRIGTSHILTHRLIDIAGGCVVLFLHERMVSIVEHDARSVANEIIQRAHDDGKQVTPMKVIKLAYFCHAWMLGLYHEPMLDEPVEAWKYGPVVPDLYDSLRRYGGSPVTRLISNASKDEFTPEETSIIDQVWAIYGKISALGLSSMTHREGTPWHQTWNAGGAFAAILDPVIEEYYQRLKENSLDERR